jgi:hypothetical protein
MEGVKVEGRDSFHQKIPMKWAIFEVGGRMEGIVGEFIRGMLLLRLINSFI